jgi:hypothetical protein
MAQIIKHRRGSIGALKDVTANVGELVIATGSIGDLNAPVVFVGSAATAGGYKAVSKIYRGSTAPILGSDYGTVMDGTPFYSSNSKTFYILDKDGNITMDLSGNLEGNTISGITINNITGSRATFDTFVSSIKNTQSQAVVYGFTHANDGSGLGSGTTALFQNCAVNFDNTVVQPLIGFNLVNLAYSTLISCGVDNGNTSSGEGINAYYLQSSNTINVISCGCENSKGRMIYLGSGSATFTGLRTIAINGATSGTVATVWCETASVLTLTDCKFEALLSAGTQLNWVIQTGGQVLEVNPQSSPTGGASFISYGGGGAKTTVTPTGTTQITSNASYKYQAYPILASFPITGTWAVGYIVYNSAPASAGYIGWVCTVAGTSGTWKTFGLIS